MVRAPGWYSRLSVPLLLSVQVSISGLQDGALCRAQQGVRLRFPPPLLLSFLLVFSHSLSNEWKKKNF